MMFPVLVAASMLMLCHGDRNSFIIGGEDAAPGMLPWQGSMEYNQLHMCGCSLISEKWVVTAAHCLYHIPPHGIVFGMTDSSDWSKGAPIRYSVKRMVVHPRYKQGSGFEPNDIALLELESPVKISSFVQPIKLPEDAQRFAGYPAIMSGWGSTETDAYPQQLRFTTAFIQPTPNCLKWGSHFNVESNICTDAPQDRGICNGDSGGPLAAWRNDEYVLAGVASYVSKGCKTSWPSVFTNVAYYKKWIQSYVNV